MSNLSYLIDYLKNEYKNPPIDLYNMTEFNAFRCLVNIRPAMAIDNEFLKIEAQVLKHLTLQKGITTLEDLSPIEDSLYLWQGDITTLEVDAIVNAANSQMTGCYCPCHGCIDNAIHTFAGVELRLECDKIMKKQGFPEPTGKAKITDAYNLPCKKIIHTVGPIIGKSLTQQDCELLASSYTSCLELATNSNIDSIAFCCISTGEFRFPNHKAAEIAIKTVKDYITKNNSRIKVIFNVFKDNDYRLYKKLLG